jgi:hypothetical protein
MDIASTTLAPQSTPTPMPTPMPAPTFRPEEPVVATLTASEWNLVFNALSELPYRVSSATIEKLRAQIVPGSSLR